jgi:uncharacterized protein (TIGR02996 family)
VTHTDDALALLRACALFPDDDTPRLMLADALDEAGDGARAELIRVQCELARLPTGRKLCHHPDYTRPVKGYSRGLTTQPYECKQTCPLCRHAHCAARESALLRDHAAGWRGRTVTWRRGFVERIDCTLADCAERSGEHCTECGNLYSTIDCRTCQTVKRHVEWRPTALARAWLTAAPERAMVRELWATDRVPYFNGKGWCWYDAGRGSQSENVPETANVPTPVWELLSRVSGVKSYRWKWWDTADAARTALARGLCAWARG